MAGLFASGASCNHYVTPFFKPAPPVPKNSENFFYLIDHAGNRRVPIMVTAKDGRYGYAVHPKGKGNDASAAEYTADEKRLVQAVVLEGRGVRCRALGGPQDGQVNTLGLGGRTVQGYWLKPDYRSLVAGAQCSSEEHACVAPKTAPGPKPIGRHSTTATAGSPVINRSTADTYHSQAAVLFADYCCQGGEHGLSPGPFGLDELTVMQEDNRRLRFSPLGNQPEHPTVALVGITPGGQIERFAKNLAAMDVPTAARQAAFHGAQTGIKALLQAHGLANHMKLTLEGDLNENPEILTTSIVKCCLMVDNGYRFGAPDIAASAAATYCATKRFIDELLAYPSLKWVMIFGEPGWNALHELQRDGQLLIDVLRGAGLSVLQMPHFAQNFQQRALFCCSPVAEAGLLEQKPEYEKFAPAARRMRDAVLQVIQQR
jgi:hypothetical protein